MRLESFHFSPAFDAAVIPEPSAGTGIPEFPDTRQTARNRGPWTLVEIVPRDGPRWRGRFELGPEDYSLSGLFATPSETQLLVVARSVPYLVTVGKACAVALLPGMPVRGVRPVTNHPLLLYWGFQDLFALSDTGLSWRVEQLGVDDVIVSEANSSSIIGTVFDGGQDEAPFRLQTEPPRLALTWSGAVLHRY